VPLYEFHCASCGPFELRRDMQEAADAAACPACAQPAGRRYTTGRSPVGPVRGASRADRARFDRARSGEPVVTGPPSGRRLPRSSGHAH
jgi:putative FmdB family regulatory protein